MRFYFLAWKRSFDFHGYSSREEFWMFMLVHTLVTIGCVLADISTSMVTWLDVSYSIFSFIPTVSATVRRLHDINKTGYWGLVFFIPIVGPFWLIYLLMQPTHSFNGGESFV